MTVEQRNIKSIICIILTCTTLFVYWQVQYHAFINFDDPLYIVENVNVQNGLCLENVVWAFSLFESGTNWIPLTLLSHIVDYELYGLNPKGHHFNNLLLHVANSLLLFITLTRMTKATWRSAFVAALFAVHPLHVESVSWVSERKDVLSTFFLMLTLWCYARYVESPGLKRYSMALFSFILGLMSKPMLVTLPFVLLLLDYWPLGRLQNIGLYGKRLLPFWLVIREKIPFLVFSAVVCVLTILSQEEGDALSSIDDFPLSVRLANAVVVYTLYIVKTIWPHNLSFFYPHSGTLPFWEFSTSAVLLACITILVTKHVRDFPWLPVGWFWYLVTLVPVIGLVQVGLQGMADRYTYIPSIGLFIIFSWSMQRMLRRFSWGRTLFGVMGGFSLILLSVYTWVQVQYWANDITLYTHALGVTSNNHVAHNNLGLALSQGGNLEEARYHFARALEIRPQSLDYRTNMGAIVGRQGKFDEAISYFSWVISRAPNHSRARYNLGLVLSAQGRFDEAIQSFSRAIEFNPDYAESYYQLGLLMAQKEKYAKAVSHFSEALRIKPLYAEAHNGLGFAFYREGDMKNALFHFSEAIRIKPDYMEAHRNFLIIENEIKNAGKTQR